MSTPTTKTWHFRLHDFHQESGFFRKRHGMILPSGEHKIFEAGREYTTQDEAFADKLRLERQSAKRTAQPVFEVFDSSEARARAAKRALEARRGSADSPEAVDGQEQSGLSVVAELEQRLAQQVADAKAAEARAAALEARFAALESALGGFPPAVVVEKAPDPAPAAEPVDAPAVAPEPEPEPENIDPPAPPAPLPPPVQQHTHRRGRRDQ